MTAEAWSTGQVAAARRGRPRLHLWSRAGIRTLGRGLLIALILTAAYWFAYQLRFDFDPPEPHSSALSDTILLVFGGKLLILILAGTHRRSWSHWGTADAVDLGRTVALGGAWVFFLHAILLNLRAFPRSVLLLDVILGFMLVGAARTVRVALRGGGRQLDGDRRRIVLVGAGETGGQLIAQLRRGNALPYRAEGIVDDDPARQGTFIHGTPILGTVEELPMVVQALQADEIIVATPSATRDQMRRIVGLCRLSNVPYRILPRTDEVLAGSIQWKQIREVQIEDLLRREAVRIDAGAIAALVAGRSILVTGGAGSIGSEIVRQVAGWAPRSLAVLDQHETGLFHLRAELEARNPTVELAVLVGDVGCERTLHRVFAEFAPEVVIHAAAYKHVPMLERNVQEAVENNVFGTLAVARAAGRAGAGTFVLISTDKAVNPTSVMGTTKRLAELVIQDVGTEFPGTCFLGVRFGNVLGSQGSVIPLFREQIARGGPVTVTHPEMQRYFMTIPEAARLVLQAATFGERGRIYILDMGEPVRIVDLATDLITLTGLEPGLDIEIRFSGIRPGEKLFEELSFDAERMERTNHPKVFRGRLQPMEHGRLAEGLGALRQSVESRDEAAVRLLLQRLVPEATLIRPTAAEPG